MKGSRLSVLSTDHGAPGEDEGDDFAPSCGPGGRPEATKGEDGDGDRRWGDRQQAWVERDQEGGSGPGPEPGLRESEQDEFPFLAEDEMEMEMDEMVLPDDRFEV